jgi:hypothetical protein
MAFLPLKQRANTAIGNKGQHKGWLVPNFAGLDVNPVYTKYQWDASPFTWKGSNVDIDGNLLNPHSGSIGETYLYFGKYGGFKTSGNAVIHYGSTAVAAGDAEEKVFQRKLNGLVMGPFNGSVDGYQAKTGALNAPHDFDFASPGAMSLFMVTMPGNAKYADPVNADGRTFFAAAIANKAPWQEDGGFLLQSSSSGKIKFTRGIGAANPALESADIVHDEFHLVEIHLDGAGNGTMIIDEGTPVTSSFTNAALTPNRLLIGYGSSPNSESPADWGKMGFCEVALYDHEQSASEKTLIRAYLNDKWGLGPSHSVRISLNAAGDYGFDSAQALSNPDLDEGHIGPTSFGGQAITSFGSTAADTFKLITAAQAVGVTDVLITPSPKTGIAAFTATWDGSAYTSTVTGIRAALGQNVYNIHWFNLEDAT